MEPFNFVEDIEIALRKYPGLKIVQAEEGNKNLAGEIDVVHEESGTLIETFAVEVHYPEKFPFCFPKVFETSGKIERTLSRHVNTANGSICLVVPPEERLICKHGISTLWFLDNVLYPRLAEEFVVMNGGKYQGEYSHGGANGYWEYYMRKLNITNTDLVLSILEVIAKKQLPVGHNPCICGSGKKFKKCHLKSTVEISDLGASHLNSDIQFLRSKPYKKTV
jgi:hypothetical protein